MSSLHQNSYSCVLADIGGTYARFGLMQADGHIHTCRKYEVRSFDGPEQALDYYCMQLDCAEKPRAVAIATAAWPYAPGKWYFAREGKWCIDIHALESSGWHIRHIENDFTASARGTLLADQDKVTCLHDPAAGRERCEDTALVIGIGTGLGLAYAGRGSEGRVIVRPTFGGHMAPPRCGERDCAELAETALSLCDDNRAPVIEDLVSGPGLRQLIRAAGIQRGSDPGEVTLSTPAIVPPDYLAPALHTFHTLLGLFINQAAQFGHAFGGVYLGGGIIGLLRENNLLDIATIRHNLCRDSVQVIQERLDAMPVYGIDDLLISFTGLRASLGNIQQDMVNA